MSLTKLSVSSIEAFDNATPFGCQTRWHFEYVQGVKGPPDASLQLGTLVHTSIEEYLKTGVNGLHPVAVRGKHLIDQYVGRVVAVEQGFDNLVISGLPFRGKIDLIAGSPREIVDWKTSSDIARYAKTVGQLKSSVQLNVYAHWYFAGAPGVDQVKASLVYFQTKGNKAERVSADITRSEAATKFAALEPLVEAMIEAGNLPVEATTPDFDKCGMARGCPHRKICPHYKQHTQLLPLLPDNNSTMSLLDRFRTIPEIPKDQLPEAPEAWKAPVPTVPDRPSSLAAEEVTVPNAVPLDQEETPTVQVEVPNIIPPRRGPGRPRKTVSPPAPAPTLSNDDFKRRKLEEMEAHKANVTATGTITKMTIRHGLTINIGNYQSAKVEVEFEAEGLTQKELSDKVREALELEAAPYRKVDEKP